MFKKSLPVVIAMIMGIFVLAACANNEQTNRDETIDNETSHSDNSTDQKSEELALPTSKLNINSNGADVKALQQVLIKLGYEITDNGKFNEDTQWAVKDFQAQQIELAATGIYDKATRKWLEKAMDGSFTIEPGKGISKDLATVSESETIIVSNPNSQLVLVNKQHALPADYIPDDLVTPNVPFPFTEDLPKKYMRKEAAKALEKMFAGANEAGLDLYAQSGYRSFDRQQALFTSYSAEHGEKEANMFSAKPGESEHQTGLTMDVTSPDIGFKINTDFAKTDEGKWIKDHAHKYGFIIRYPKGKEKITEYQYEPWHLRYVGKKAAEVIYQQQITLEEYLGVTKV